MTYLGLGRVGAGGSEADLVVGASLDSGPEGGGADTLNSNHCEESGGGEDIQKSSRLTD